MRRPFVSMIAIAGGAALVLGACGGDDSNGGGGAPDGGGGGPDGSASIDGALGGDAAPIDATVPPPPAPTCTPPIQSADVSMPTTTIGAGGTACDEAALTAAIAKGGVITFACGAMKTIAIASQLDLPKGKDVVIDGGGTITLDGGGKTRIFHFDGGDFRKTMTKITLQHITLANAKATGTMIPSAPAPCSQGFNTDGGGAAILVRDGVLHVIDVTFANNAAASPGPDVAGGGVYVIGSIDATIVASRFSGNTASNGGAIGSLFSNLTLVNDTFSQNEATGAGANSIDTAHCSAMGGEVGNGGNGGAVSMDGGEEFAVSICGSTFTGNTAGALAGAVFRTPDNNRQQTNIDKCTFDGNTAAVSGGGALYFHHSDLTITATTFANNSAMGAGAIQADDTVLNLTNDTFTNNSATHGLGGAISLFGNGGTFLNCTFANNHSDGGSGLFAAAIAGGSTFTIDNTIFANNTSMDAGAPMTCQENGTGVGDFQWPQKHIVGTAADNACVTNITFADPMLGMLADNTGPTKTMVPMTGSPAIGAGKACPPTDQRGKPRKTPDGCTAGAVEVP